MAAGGEGFRKKYYRERLLALLGILLLVALWRAVVLREEARPIDWTYTHEVLACPIVGPGASAAPLREHLAAAGERLDAWAAEQYAASSGRQARPLRFTFAEPVAASSAPPKLPDEDEGFLTRWRKTRAFLRFFRAQGERFPEPGPDGTRIYLFLHPASDRARWADVHSVATRRGKIGVVFAPDDPAEWGNTECLVVHEALHTVGALDHREEDGTIAHPSGYADPSKRPLFPQEAAEIMALGIPVSPTEELRVSSLDEVVVGRWTAAEIGWLEEDAEPHSGGRSDR